MKIDDTRESRASDKQSGQVQLFDYELHEDDLQMLRILQQREGLTSLRAAMRECLGIVSTLVHASREGQLVMLSKDGQVRECGIDSLSPHPELDNVSDWQESSNVVGIWIEDKLEASYGYSYDRAIALGLPIKDYKKRPLPDGEWIGELEFKIIGERPSDHKLFMSCYFKFIREVTCDGKHRGRPGEKYCLYVWKPDGGGFTPKLGNIDMGALEVKRSTRLRLRTHTGFKTSGKCEEWGYWDCADPVDSVEKPRSEPQAAPVPPPPLFAPGEVPPELTREEWEKLQGLFAPGEVPSELTKEEWEKLEPDAILTPEIAAIEAKRFRRALYEVWLSELGLKPVTAPGEGDKQVNVEADSAAGEMEKGNEA